MKLTKVVFLALCLLISRPTSAGVVGGPQSAHGELEPNHSETFQYTCEKDEPCYVKVTFSPKYQRERTKAECEQFVLKLWVDGQWFTTAGGYLQYVDTGSSEVLVCKAAVGYQGGKTGSKRRSIIVELSNNNAWKGVFDLQTT